MKAFFYKRGMLITDILLNSGIDSYDNKIRCKQMDKWMLRNFTEFWIIGINYSIGIKFLFF